MQIRIGKLTLVSFLIPLGVLFLYSSLSSSNQSFAQSNSSSGNAFDCRVSDSTGGEESNLIPAASAEIISSNGPYISVTTDLVKYIAGDIVGLSGTIIGGNGCPLQQPVNLEVTRGSEVVYAITVIADSDGYFSDSGLNADKAGVYSVKAVPSGTAGGNYAIIKFEVKEMFDTRPAYMLYIGMGFFGGLAFIVSREIKNIAVTEMWRFVCLTGIAFSIIAALLLTDVQIGSRSPVGLVLKTADASGNCDQSVLYSEIKGEWMINFGGNPPYYCGTGIQVPVNIIVFGIAGGYLRYLWDTARLREKMQEVMKKNTQHTIARTWLFYVSLHDLALFLLAPLLAIVVWFVLSASGATGLLTIAAVSFTVGLVTEEIIQTLIRFTTSVLRAAESASVKTQDKTIEMREISNGNGNGNGKKEGIEKKGEVALVQKNYAEDAKLTNDASTTTAA
jgi:hypothetical protein